MTREPNKGSCGMVANQIDDVFAARKALICYAPIGDPNFPMEMLEIYQSCGVDIIEIGLPNDDPYADGKVIADSMRRTSKAVSMKEMVRLTSEVRSRFPNLVVTWMCYECADLGEMVASGRDAGLRGLLMVGLERRADKRALLQWLSDNEMHHIGFVSADLRANEVAAAQSASGYVFLQAFGGKTGARSEDLPVSLKHKIDFLRRSGIAAPIALGFGISTADQVRQAVQFGADGVITGSACVRAALDGPQALEDYLSGLREALDDAAAEMVA